MKNNIYKYGFFLSLLLTGCGGGDSDIIDPDNPPTSEKRILLNSKIAEGRFVEGDELGLFVASWKDNTSKPLDRINNYVHNMRLTYTSGIWSSEKVLYWKDDVTPADFVAYSPYASRMFNPNAFAFHCKTDQSSEANLKASDLLWGKTVGEKPREENIDLTLNHLMSQIRIHLKAGEGFTDEEIDSATISVRLKNIYAEALVNLSTGETTPGGKKSDITAFKESNHSFKALLIPQNYSETQFIEVDFNGDIFLPVCKSELTGGKVYTYTLTLAKRKGGLQVGVSDWDILDNDFGGVVN